MNNNEKKTNILKNKNIVITGANRGIGKEIMALCAWNGANIWACMRTITDETMQYITDLALDGGVTIKPVKLDLSDEGSVRAAATSILADKMQIHGIVNNAGVTGPNKLFTMTPMDIIKKVFEVNFFMPMLFTQRLLKNMIRGKTGSIVNISSIAALDGEPAQFEYVSSKAALIGATRKLASELGAFQIRVNAVAPGVTNTDMGNQIEEGLRNHILDSVIMKRMGRPEEIAEAVCFLLSDHSAYMTGQVMRIDGGKR